VFFAVPHPCPLAVDTGLPGFQDIAVALPTKEVQVLEIHCLIVQESELVPLGRIMAIETPSFGFSMALYLDILME